MRTVLLVIDHTIHCRRLSEHLATLCTAMEDLVYHLEVHVLVLAAGSAARVHRSAADVERSAAAVAQAELARTEFVHDHVPMWSAMTLSALIASVDEPWRGVLDHQRHALEVLQASTADLSDEASRVARLSARRHRELLQVVAGPGEPLVHGFGSKSSLARTAPLLVDRSA